MSDFNTDTSASSTECVKQDDCSNKCHRMCHSFNKLDAIRIDQSHSLCRRLNKAVEVIENTLRLYLPSNGTNAEDDGHIFISFNGGKDATVVLHLLHYVLYKQHRLHLLGPTIKVIYFDDPHQFPAIEQFIKDSLHSLQVEPVTFKCSFKEGVERAKETYNLQAVLMGVRLGDPYTDDAEHFHPSTANYPAFMRVYPILHWDYADGMRCNG